MGIPSYFRRILQAYPGCLLRAAPSLAQALCFDFNCLIYRCLRAPTLPPPPPSTDPYALEMWEEELLQEVLRTVKEVWSAAGRPPRVFLAVDGVVPMAKIRQQRVRRFKSAWLRKQSALQSWDSNAITPGTAFMCRLDAKLQELVEAHGSRWELSGSCMPGEGEHKILEWLRKGSFVKEKEKPILVYGLDADLILLTMLVGEQCDLSMYLFREAMEFGQKEKEKEKGSSSLKKEQEYQCMNIQEFKYRLGISSGYEQVLNYIGLMSLMGNDFLPHSITHKLNDNGHEYVLKELQAGTKLVSKDGLVNMSVLQEICSRWSVDEAEKMHYMIVKKKDQARRGVLPGMDESEALPLTWMVENALLESGGRGLSSNWRDHYWSWILPNQYVTYAEKQGICSEYAYGCQWILDYYLGKPVDKLWMFPSWIPPLWSDLAHCPLTIYQKDSSEKTIPIQPQEQLAMVLPLDSWDLARDTSLRQAPSFAPQYWPSSFGFLSAGRKWLWECEALIPPLRIETLRETVVYGNAMKQ
jgi:5'-3' exonuclease